MTGLETANAGVRLRWTGEGQPPTRSFPLCLEASLTRERGLKGRHPVSFDVGLEAHSSRSASDRKNGASSPANGECAVPRSGMSACIFIQPCEIKELLVTFLAIVVAQDVAASNEAAILLSDELSRIIPAIRANRGSYDHQTPIRS